MPALAVTGKAKFICLAAGWGGFGLIWLAFGEDEAFSFLLGALAAFFYVVLLTRQVVRSLTSGSKGSKGAAVRYLFFRYLFLILVLAALFTLDWIRMEWVLGGLLLIPVSIVAAAWRRS